MKDETVFLRDIEVAIRYGISRSTIWRWLKTGKIPQPFKIGEGSTRWRLDDLKVWEQLKVQKKSEEKINF